MAYNETPTTKGKTMPDNFLAKFEAAYAKDLETYNGEKTKEGNAAFFDAVIDFWDEEMAGDYTLPDGSRFTVPPIK